MGLPSASIVENVQFNRLVIVPNAVQGIFKRRPQPVSVATRLDVDGSAVRFVAGLRDSHGPGPLWVRVVTDRVLFLLDVADIRRVLEGSPDPFASDPAPKRKGMGHFQPHALTLSRGALWVQRRRFTEAVLDSAAPVHRLADQFVAIAREETDALIARAGTRLEWDDWHPAFQRITRRVVLGDEAADDTEVTELQGQLMSEANGMPSDRSDSFEPFVERLRGYVEADAPGGLVGLFGEQRPSADLAATGQVPHWLFAMGDTLPANAFRTLALIATHGRQRAAVLEEIGEAGGGLDARALAGLSYLRACVHEAMRLWPTTPLLSRETLADVELGGETIPAGTQVLWFNTFFHRDGERVPYADNFAPEEWTDDVAGQDWSFNHFSHGPQGCPGVNVSLLLASTVLVDLLTRCDVQLERPKLNSAKPLPHMLDYFSLRFAL